MTRVAAPKERVAVTQPPGTTVGGSGVAGHAPRSETPTATTNSGVFFVNFLRHEYAPLREVRTVLIGLLRFDGLKNSTAAGTPAPSTSTLPEICTTLCFRLFAFAVNATLPG